MPSFKTTGFENYEEFWPYYLSEHSLPVTRGLHYFGTTTALLVALGGVAAGAWWMLAVGFVWGYVPAWISHFFLEKNRPATFGRAPVGENTVREVVGAQWRREGQLLVFRITADAFLYRMVRSVVGSLKMVGSGRWSVDDFAVALRARERKRSATAAPAHGLYLVAVEYDETASVG